MWETPYLALDVAVLDRNITAMASWAEANNVALRPHAKTHKSPQIALRQLDAGAVGLTVATVGEAQAFADGIPDAAGSGARDLFIAYPLWMTWAKARRLAAVMEHATVAIGCDSPEAIEVLLRHRDVFPRLPELMVEVDSGQHRSGVAPEEAGEVASYAAERGFAVRGVFTFPGHSYGPELRQRAAHEEAGALRTAAQTVEAAGIVVRVISGGSTPSLHFSDASVVTELRPGVYVTGDAQQLELGTCTLEEIALTVRSTVVSRRGNRVVLDAGSKALGADRAAWATGFGRIAENLDARVVALSEHHATVEWNGPTPPQLGEHVNVIPNHACNAINLADAYCVVRDEAALVEAGAAAAERVAGLNVAAHGWSSQGPDGLVAQEAAGTSWPITARGRNA